MTPRYVYVIKASSGEVVPLIPADKYQEVYGLTGENEMPLPWRFSPNNPDAESFTAELMDFGAFQPVATDGGPLYYDESGELCGDPDWEHSLMNRELILEKHVSRLNAAIDLELALAEPDPVKLVGLQRKKEVSSKLTDLEVYRVALSYLPSSDVPKPGIEAKLVAKIAELEAPPEA